MPTPLPAAVGTILARLVVPAWILTGATFKLVHQTPKNLPRSIFEPAHAAGIDLFVLLFLIIAVEFVAAGAMLIVPRVARRAAILMLGIFCLVLMVEMAGGNFVSCGCLGAVKMPPWLMFIIDASMLAGILLSARSPQPAAPEPRWPLAAAGLWGVAGFVLSGAVLLDKADGNGDSPPPPLTGTDAPPAGGGNPPPAADAAPALPSYYLPDCDSWVGQRWADVDLAKFLPGTPPDIETGRRYLIFFQRSCDHCVLLFENHFYEQAPVPTTIVAIPELREGFDRASWLDYQCTGCDELELPAGCDWIITTPIIVALEDGIVRCASEGEEPDEPKCLLWH
jgi:hypothetical protein